MALAKSAGAFLIHGPSHFKTGGVSGSFRIRLRGLSPNDYLTGFTRLILEVVVTTRTLMASGFDATASWAVNFLPSTVLVPISLPMPSRMCTMEPVSLVSALGVTEPWICSSPVLKE